MIVAPPLDTGATQVTAADENGVVLVTPSPVGAPGVAATVTAVDAADAGPVPTPFVARTLNVYDEPFVRPVTAHDNAGAVAVQVAPPGLAVAVDDVTGAPPSEIGASQLTVAWVGPPTAVTVRGWPGTTAPLTAVSVAAQPETPSAVTVRTWKKYDADKFNPVTVVLVDAAVRGVAGNQMTPPVEYWMLYPVIGDEPLLAGATQVTFALVKFPATRDALTVEGAPGLVMMSTHALDDRADSPPGPYAETR